MVKASKNWIVCAGMDGDGNSPHKEYALHLWDMDQTEIIKSLKGFREPVRCLEVDWPSRRVLTGSEDGMLQLTHLFKAKVFKNSAGIVMRCGPWRYTGQPLPLAAQAAFAPCGCGT